MYYVIDGIFSGKEILNKYTLSENGKLYYNLQHVYHTLNKFYFFDISSGSMYKVDKHNKLIVKPLTNKILIDDPHSNKTYFNRGKYWISINIPEGINTEITQVKLEKSVTEYDLKFGCGHIAIPLKSSDIQDLSSSKIYINPDIKLMTISYYLITFARRNKFQTVSVRIICLLLTREENIPSYIEPNKILTLKTPTQKVYFADGKGSIIFQIPNTNSLEITSQNFKLMSSKVVGENLIAVIQPNILVPKETISIYDFMNKKLYHSKRSLYSESFSKQLKFVAKTVGEKTIDYMSTIKFGSLLDKQIIVNLTVYSDEIKNLNNGSYIVDVTTKLLNQLSNIIPKNTKIRYYYLNHPKGFYLKEAEYKPERLIIRFFTDDKNSPYHQNIQRRIMIKKTIRPILLNINFPKILN